MDDVMHPWQFLLIGLAGWINRSQQEAIEYLRTENQVLREVVGKKRILLNDDQRRRLAVKGKMLGLRGCVNWRESSHLKPFCDGIDGSQMG